MLIMKRKFDIRMWVVIPSWNPLRIYVYKDCYCRFSCNDYDPRTPSNLFSHLTNNSISKKVLQRADNIKALKKIPGNMWFLHQLRSHLTKKKREQQEYYRMLASRASDAYGDKDADGDMKQSKELERLLLDQEVKEDEVDLDAQVEADDD